MFDVVTASGAMWPRATRRAAATLLEARLPAQRPQHKTLTANRTSSATERRRCHATPMSISMSDEVWLDAAGLPPFMPA